VSVHEASPWVDTAAGCKHWSPAPGMSSSVTLAAAKSSGLKTVLLYGQIPVTLKLHIGFSGVAVCRYAFPNIVAISYTDILLPGFATIQLSAFLLYALFKDLKNVTSKGWSLWVL